jgi:hypothetical protein
VTSLSFSCSEIKVKYRDDERKESLLKSAQWSALSHHFLRIVEGISSRAERNGFHGADQTEGQVHTIRLLATRVREH